MSVVTTAMRELGHHVAGAHERVLVMTYNVLAQTYVKSSWFPYCDPLALRWKNRSKKLEEVFQSLPVRPHVVCLQEVDNFYEFWAKIMKRMGYEGLYVQKQGRKKEGVAIFWHDAKLNMVKHETVGLDIPLGDESGGATLRKDLLGRTARGSVGLIAEFAIRSAPGPSTTKTKDKDKTPAFAVATTHLFWDPLQEDVKLLQTRRMVRHLAGYNEKQQLPLILAGDFNSLPDSEVYRFITDSHGYKSAYSEYDQSETPPREPAFTNVNGLRNDEQNRQIPGFIGTLDYIFYQSPRLQPVALLEIMSREEAIKEQSLPSTFSPSDHLPMICDFALTLE